MFSSFLFLCIFYKLTILIPPPAVIVVVIGISRVFRILKRGRGTFQLYIFKSVQILAYFFTLKISTIFFSSPMGVQAQPPKYAPEFESNLFVRLHYFLLYLIVLIAMTV